MLERVNVTPDISSSTRIVHLLTHEISWAGKPVQNFTIAAGLRDEREASARQAGCAPRRFLFDDPSREMATRYLRTVVTAVRRRLAKLEDSLIPDTRHAPAGKTHVHVECVALPGAESLACPSNCEVCWDGR